MASKRCKQCRKKHNDDDILKMKSTPSNLGMFCDHDCIADWVKDNPKKIKTLQSMAYDAETRKLKAKVIPSDTQKQHKLTQTVFNRMRKLEELLWYKLKRIEPECVSCGKKNMDWCCGHFKTVGSSGHLRYDRINTYLQCNKYCNMSLSGNIAGNKQTRGYRQGLIDRFGEVKAQEINDYCEKSVVKKWTGPELVAMRTEFNIEIRRLEKIIN